MARPKTNFDPTREALLRTACRLFSERGYEETPISLIMGEAGLSKAGMYHYFASKEEILEEAIGLYVQRGVERLRAASAGKPLEERLVHFILGAGRRDGIERGLEAMKGSSPGSYAAYRIRERSLHADIPLLAEILEEGMELGLYRRAGSPRAVASVLVLQAKALAEGNYLPPAGPEERLERLEAYLDLLRTWLDPPEVQYRKLEKLFRAELGAESGLR